MFRELINDLHVLLTRVQCLLGFHDLHEYTDPGRPDEGRKAWCGRSSICRGKIHRL